MLAMDSYSFEKLCYDFQTILKEESYFTVWSAYNF